MLTQRTWGGPASIDGKVIEDAVDVSMTTCAEGGNMTFEEYIKAVALLLAPLRLLATAVVWPLALIGALLGRRDI